MIRYQTLQCIFMTSSSCKCPLVRYFDLLGYLVPRFPPVIGARGKVVLAGG
jgi:hypothetical protein